MQCRAIGRSVSQSVDVKGLGESESENYLQSRRVKGRVVKGEGGLGERRGESRVGKRREKVAEREEGGRGGGFSWKDGKWK